MLAQRLEHIFPRVLWCMLLLRVESLVIQVCQIDANRGTMRRKMQLALQLDMYSHTKLTNRNTLDAGEGAAYFLIHQIL